MHVESEQAVQSKVPFTHAIVGAMQLAVEGQHQRDGVLGHGIRRICRHAYHADSVFCCGCEIDIVIACAT